MTEATDHSKGSMGQEAHETVQRAQDVVHETAELVGHVKRVKGGWQQQAVAVAAERPYLALAVVTAAGFVLGGGMSTLLSRRLWRVGGKIAMSLALQQLTQGSLLGSVKKTLTA